MDTQAHKHLLDLLSLFVFEARRVPYMEKCIIGLRDGMSVMQCLRLAKGIFELFPK